MHYSTLGTEVSGVQGIIYEGKIMTYMYMHGGLILWGTAHTLLVLYNTRLVVKEI